LPLDFPIYNEQVNAATLERARMLRSLGEDFRVIAAAIRPYCKTMRERDDVLRAVYT
jgi:hypothetical protein